MRYRPGRSKRGAAKVFGLSVGFGAATLLATAAWAHHSFAAFDLTKTVEVSGEVKEWRWTNPHSWLVVATRDASGAAQEINLEANGPGYLVRQGWKQWADAGYAVQILSQEKRATLPYA